MKHLHRLTLSAAFVLALPSLVAQAQVARPPALPDLPGVPEPAASTPGRGSTAPGPRLRSPVETGNRAAAPGALHPERPVVPQISIPLGKKPAPIQGEARRAPQRKVAPDGTIDDAAARCEASADASVQAACRARLAREAPK